MKKWKIDLQLECVFQHFAYIWSHMSIQGEANEFLNLLFGELNERRFAQVIKVKINQKYLKRMFTHPFFPSRPIRN